MITLACLECRLALRTSSESHDEVNFLIGMYSEWYPDRYPCPRFGCNGKMTLTDTIASSELALLEMHDVTPQEAFQALQGMGLPAEKECHPDDVRAFFAQPIKAVEVSPLPGTTRSVVRSFIAADGTRLFIGSSPFGAVVYRIAPPRSAAREVLNEG
jgi:hypothetical protein